eukprot:2778446-Prorocentrum_lima.AAC.1
MEDEMSASASGSVVARTNCARKHAVTPRATWLAGALLEQLHSGNLLMAFSNAGHRFGESEEMYTSLFI